MAGILVPSDAVSRLGLMPVLSRAALLSLDTTGLQAPPTLCPDCRKLELTVSYISLSLGAMVRWQEDKTEPRRLKHQQLLSLVGQNDHGFDPIDPCKDFALSTWVLSRLLPTRTRDKKSFKPPCHDLPNRHARGDITAARHQQTTQDPSTPSQVFHRTHTTVSLPLSQMLPRILCANDLLPDDRCRRWMVDSSFVESSTTEKCNTSIRSSSEYAKKKGVNQLYTELPIVDIKMSLPVSRNSGRPQMPKHRYYCQYSFRFPQILPI